MKKLLAFCMMLFIVFNLSANPTPSPISKKLNFNNNQIENFKKPVPVLVNYLFKYDLTPTGTPGQWNVYLALYAKYSDGSTTLASSPTSITVTMTSPIYFSALFPAFTQYQYFGIIDVGTPAEEYTYDIAITTSVTSINGYPISPIAQHL